ncbi:hypothetical protein DRQ50_10630 [bacterium]|nr:MAG: hypothetical protein DRQ50_10630 [bacterium]
MPSALIVRWHRVSGVGLPLVNIAIRIDRQRSYIFDDGLRFFLSLICLRSMTLSTLHFGRLLSQIMLTKRGAPAGSSSDRTTG